MDQPLYLDIPGGVHNTVNVHPLVLLSILDHHIRRDSTQERVIGALLGTVVNGVVEVTDAFGVGHALRDDTVRAAAFFFAHPSPLSTPVSVVGRSI
jgi:hypothetical protein